MLTDAVCRRTYVISDLHLGGHTPAANEPDSRGFRIFTHTVELSDFISRLTAMPAGPDQTKGIPRIELVINGDIVDFLAETDGGPQRWSAVKSRPGAAIEAFEAIARSEAAIFESLAAFLQKGHRLTLLLGNHDIELAFPDVRRRLEELLSYDGHQDFQFIYDGEAYTIGDVLIEHGNRYDPFNVTNNDSLRRARSLMSRNQDVSKEHAFQASSGSHIVTEILNPIKVDYPFVDLLKPENETVIPMLLALEPKYRSVVGKFIRLAAQSRRHRLAAPAMPSAGSDITAKVETMTGLSDITMSDESSTAPQARKRLVDAALAAVENADDDAAANIVLAFLLRNDFAEFETALLEASATIVSGDIAGILDRGKQYGSSLWLMLTHCNAEQIERRLPALRVALGAVIESQCFDPNVETGTDYLRAAVDLATRGFKLIIFGHTHLPKDINLKVVDARYINTGSWADIIKFDKLLLTNPPPPEKGTAPRPSPLQQFVEAIKKRDFAKWIDFSPCYARLDFKRDDHAREKLAKAELVSFQTNSVGA